MSKSKFQQVMDCIKEHHPITIKEIANLVGVTQKEASGYVSSHKLKGRCHISGWEQFESELRLATQAQFSPGKRRNAPRPAPLTCAQLRARAKSKKVLQVPSIFAMGQALRPREPLDRSALVPVKRPIGITQTAPGRLPGAHFHKPSQQWCSSIGVNGRQVHLGYFESPEDASAAYMQAKQKYHHWSPNA